MREEIGSIPGSWPRVSHEEPPQNRDGSLAAAAIAAVLLVCSPAFALAQGSLTTSDGMRLALDADGSVSSLQVGGLEYASPSILSGFVYRELPATVSSVAPNGSFESGSTFPDVLVLERGDGRDVDLGLLDGPRSDPDQ
jgi:hypothetical protein